MACKGKRSHVDVSPKCTSSLTPYLKNLPDEPHDWKGCTKTELRCAICNGCSRKPRREQCVYQKASQKVEELYSDCCRIYKIRTFKTMLRLNNSEFRRENFLCPFSEDPGCEHPIGGSMLRHVAKYHYDRTSTQNSFTMFYDSDLSPLLIRFKGEIFLFSKGPFGDAFAMTVLRQGMTNKKFTCQITVRGSLKNGSGKVDREFTIGHTFECVSNLISKRKLCMVQKSVIDEMTSRGNKPIITVTIKPEWQDISPIFPH